ncbi:hypothetical protein B8W69_00370 [Mycobacterium vulneris]|uniref:DUF732 domain-containing protein n=1 Tax=Mycolicibacterium vulneris TaxID=547163 RepID=A0A1X2LEB1_9MYCO|nr:DUF732 domain-containing protein [Mycolicibacterium vulneris]OSC32287.1 hypothetical protein B8W69_00370 [Mycolicibacterium vulneris]
MRAVIAAAVFAASIVGAPLAQAEPGDPNAASNDDQFGQYMIARGMMGSYLQDGHSSCAALRSGATTQSQVNRLEAKLSAAEANTVVYAAMHYLCPGV